MHHGLADARASLLAVTRAAVAAGLLPGTAGNLSLRDAASELIVITPSQIPYATLTPDSMVVIDLDGAVVEGQHPPSSEWRLHVALYRARPDAGAIVHTHSPYATALAILDEGRRSPVWRFSLEDVATGNRCGFADLDALLVHLLALMEPATPVDLHTPSPPQPHACHTLED